MTIGQRLADRRKKLGVSLEQVEAELKIRRRYLEALEADRYEILLGDAYAKGIIRSYATFLGLDPGPLLAEYDMQRTQAEPPALLARLEPLRSPAALIGVIVLVLLAILSIVLVLPERSTQPQLPVAPTDSLVPTEPPAGGTTVPPAGGSTPTTSLPETTASASTPKPFTVRITVTGSDRCWVLMKSEGKTLIARTLAPGETATAIVTEAARLQLGRPAVVTLSIDGTTIPIPHLPSLEATLTRDGLVR
jgi:cytoskeletal protein RodZ